MWWISLKYFLVGALFCIVGTFLLGGSHGFIGRSEPAKLIVLQMDSKRELIQRHGNRRTSYLPAYHTVYRPVFGLVTDARPRPSYKVNTWMSPAPHQIGDVVAGRYDPASGEMRSNSMIDAIILIAWIVDALGVLAILQGILLCFGIPEVLLLLRVN